MSQKAKLYEWHMSNKKDKPAKKPAEVNSTVAAPVAPPAIDIKTLRSVIVAVMKGNNVMNNNAPIPRRATTVSLVDCETPSPVIINKITKVETLN